MKRMKIAAALILAACFTVLPAYSLAAAYRAGHISAAPPQGALRAVGLAEVFGSQNFRYIAGRQNPPALYYDGVRERRRDFLDIVGSHDDCGNFL